MKLQAVLLCLAAMTVMSWAEAAPLKRLEDLPDFAKYKDLLTMARASRSSRVKRDTNGTDAPFDPDVEIIPQCVTAAAAGCLQTFTTALGFPYPLPTTAVTFQNEWLTYVRTKGLLPFCQSFSALQSCLGSSFGGCLENPINVMKNIGANAPNAVLYVALIAQQQWECGPGLNLLLNHGKCIYNVLTQNSARFTACYNKLIAGINSNPNLICSDYQQFISCYTIEMNRGCGTPTAYAVCEGIRVGTMKAHPGCETLGCPTVNQ